MVSSKFGAASINAIFWFYFASLMTKEGYGEYGFLLSIATIGHSISMIGLSSTIVVYGAKKEDILGPSYTLGLISSVFVSILVFIFTNNFFLSLLVVFMTIFILFTSELASKKQYKEYSIYIILQRILNIVFAFLLFPLFGINGLLLSFIIANSPSLKGLANYLKTEKVTFTIFRPKIKFMINNHLTSLNNILFWWGDKILIGTLFNFSSLANYQIAVQVLMMLHTIPSALYIYLVPNESEGKNKSVSKRYSIVASILITISSIIFIPTLIDTFLPKFSESIFSIQIMSIAIIPITSYLILESEFLGKGFSLPLILGSTIQIIVYFSLLVILGNLYGMDGFSMSFLISSFARLIIYFIIKLKNN